MQLVAVPFEACAMSSTIEAFFWNDPLKRHNRNVQLSTIQPHESKE